MKTCKAYMFHFFFLFILTFYLRQSDHAFLMFAWSASEKTVLSYPQESTELLFRLSRRWTFEAIVLLGQQLILSSTEKEGIKLFHLEMQKTYPKSSIKPIYCLVRISVVSSGFQHIDCLAPICHLKARIQYLPHI